MKKYLLYSLSFHALVVTLLLLFGGEGPPPPPPKTQITMIRLSRGAGDVNAPLFQKPAYQAKPTEPQPAAPSPAKPAQPVAPTPPIPVAKPAPVIPAKPITPTPAKPAPTPAKPSQPTINVGKPTKPASPKPAQPPAPAKPATPVQAAQPAQPSPDEAKLNEALGQVQKELEQREATANTPPTAPGTTDGSGSGAPAGVPGGQVGAADPGLAQYQSNVRSKIVRTWVRANTGPDAEQAIRTRVQVRINASGQVIGKNVVKSSGNESFDLSALRAIERASPFPPPPAGLESEAVTEGFVVDFSSRMLGRK